MNKKRGAKKLVSKQERRKQLLQELAAAGQSGPGEDRRLAILYKITSLIAEITDLDELYSTLCDSLFIAFGAQRCVIMMKPQATSRRLKTVAARTIHGQGLKQTVSKSILREVYRYKKAVLCTNAMSDTRFLGDSITQMRIRSVICAPLLYHDEVIGVINLDSSFKSHAFSYEDLELLTGVALQAASAYALLQADLMRRNYIRTLEALDRATLKLSALLQRDRIIRKTAIYACNLLRCTKSSVILQNGSQLILAHSVGLARPVSSTIIPDPQGLAAWVIKHSRPLLSYDGCDLPDGLQPSRRPRYKRDSFLIVPLVQTDKKGTRRTIGAICATDRTSEQNFDTQDQEFLSLLADQAGIALANAALYESATIDELTNLFVRRYFFQKLQALIKAAGRNNRPLALLMLDIDHFKSVNDRYGHPTGDVVLRELGQLLHANIRENDIAARYGGEEFALLLYDTNLATAQLIAERIRSACEKHLFDQQDHCLHLTISIGIAMLMKGLRRRQLIARADQALYQAKNKGRNQIQVYQDGAR